MQNVINEVGKDGACDCRAALQHGVLRVVGSTTSLSRQLGYQGLPMGFSVSGGFTMLKRCWVVHLCVQVFQLLDEIYNDIIINMLKYTFRFGLVVNVPMAPPLLKSFL